jgi:hypothetical protein
MHILPDIVGVPVIYHTRQWAAAILVEKCFNAMLIELIQIQE